ncbi:MAG: ATP-binding protein [Proteobacteria bacterium]|jgi:signal transduction histidine kinase|nr:ATP-binding protein [Pseudomonadota bacterium]
MTAEKDRLPGEDATRLSAFRDLSRSLAQLGGGELSESQYLQRVSGDLLEHVAADVVAWDLTLGGIEVRARLVRRPSGLEWITNPGPEPLFDAAGGHAIALGLRAFEDVGSLRIARAERPFSEDERILCEIVGSSIAVALANRVTGASLRERVKEMRCLVAVAQLAEQSDRPFDEVLTGITSLLAPAMMYPEIASARIVLDDSTYESGAATAKVAFMEADIFVRGERRGVVRIAYDAIRPAMHEGPFLREERRLLDAVANELTGIIERREALEQRALLEEQIRHADRLATIGQLAAGVAHELNEPLGAILGFAQLLTAQGGLDDAVSADLDKIVAACLHARDIVNKLRLFARQSPPSRAPVDLNEVIQDGLYFTEAQCARQGVSVVRDLDPDLPAIDADRGQVLQVLTNLTVNAMQAMPGGGTLTIRTRRREREVAMIVQDDGVGMTKENVRKIFVPFFTTKPADQGTGLGLSVVHGIVAAHGGTIEVRSEAGAGAAFEVRLPLEREP